MTGRGEKFFERANERFNEELYLLQCVRLQALALVPNHLSNQKKQLKNKPHNAPLFRTFHNPTPPNLKTTPQKGWKRKKVRWKRVGEWNGYGVGISEKGKK